MPLSKSYSSYYSNRNRIRTAHEKNRGFAALNRSRLAFPRKEVIQPQVPLRLPCYDFTPLPRIP